MPLEDVLPIWSQWGIVGVLATALVYFVVAFVHGDIASRKQLDQVQRMADTFKDAWIAEQQVKTDLSNAVVRLTDVADTIEHFIKSLPTPGDDDA